MSLNNISPATTVSFASLETIAPKPFFARHLYKPVSSEDKLDRRRVLFDSFKGMPLRNLQDNS